MSDVEKAKFGGADAKLDKIDRALTFLRAKHPIKTADCVSAEAGIPANTVAKWLSGASRPGFEHTMALIGAYGPEFLSEVCYRSRLWAGPAAKLQRLRSLQCQRRELDKQIRDLGGHEHEDAAMGSGSMARDVGRNLPGGRMADGTFDPNGYRNVAGEADDT